MSHSFEYLRSFGVHSLLIFAVTASSCEQAAASLYISWVQDIPQAARSGDAWSVHFTHEGQPML